jgi:hypothetical protein
MDYLLFQGDYFRSRNLLIKENLKIGGFKMEFLDFAAWFQYFLLINSGCLVLLLLLLFYSNRYTRKKINEIEKNDENFDF